MPSNVEIKARVSDMAALKQTAEKLADQPFRKFKQLDHFYHSPNGRFKLRSIIEENRENIHQLIFYKRSDEDGPKLSEYEIMPVSTSDFTSMDNMLYRACGRVGTVKKTRHLYMAGQTRIHIDEVEGLGNFMELEVVLDEDQSTEKGESIANKLMEQLSIEKNDLVTGAYLDLILKQ